MDIPDECNSIEDIEFSASFARPQKRRCNTCGHEDVVPPVNMLLAFEDRVLCPKCIERFLAQHVGTFEQVDE